MSIDSRTAFIYTVRHGHSYPPLYDCSNKTINEWYETGLVQWPIGVYFLATGIVLEILYAPCLIAMVKQNILKFPCYKIMFFLGFLDMFSIFAGSIMTGYLTIKGAVFCTNPLLILSLGASGCGCWCASCMTCILLALGRCADFSNSRPLKMIFEGYRLYFLLFVIVLYLLFIMFFTAPPTFNSNYVSWFFNPMLGHEVFIQSFFICITNAVAAYVYVYMQYFPAPKLLVLTGHIAWQFSAGFVCIIYLVVNRTIRHGVIKLVVPNGWKNMQKKIFASISVAPSNRVVNSTAT